VQNLTPTNPTRLLLLRFGKFLLIILILGVLVALMSIPEFDPGSVKGGVFGMIVMALWGGGLLIWALGLAKQSGARLRIRTVLLAFGVLAVTFGAFPWLPLPYSIQVGMGAISAVMAYEGQRHQGDDGRPTMAWRGGKSRLLLSLAGLFGLAIITHNIFRI
jgi:hypothetical protein